MMRIVERLLCTWLATFLAGAVDVRFWILTKSAGPVCACFGEPLLLLIVIRVLEDVATLG